MSLISMYMGGKEVQLERTREHALVAFHERHSKPTYEVVQFGQTLDKCFTFLEAKTSAEKNTGGCQIYRVEPSGRKHIIFWKPTTFRIKGGKK